MSHFFPTEVWSHARKPRSVYRYFSYQRIGAFTAIFDFTLIVAASIATGVVYHFLVFDAWGDIDAFVVIGCYSGLTFVLLSKVLGLYHPNGLLYAGAQIRGILAAWGATALFMTSLLFLLKTGADYSRGATISFDFLGVVLIVAFRYVTALNLRRALANGTLGGQRVIVIGDPEELAIKPKTDLLRTYGAREVGRFELSPASGPTLSNIAHDIEVIDSVIRAARASYAEQVLLALRWVDTVRTDYHLRTAAGTAASGVSAAGSVGELDPFALELGPSSARPDRSSARSFVATGFGRQASLRRHVRRPSLGDIFTAAFADRSGDKVGLRWSGYLSPTPPRLQRSRVRDLQIPHDDGSGRRQHGSASATR